MPEEDDLVELKFRLYDGSDIGPIHYASSSTISMVKERIISEWPKDKKIIPKVANDVKLISGGKILENQKTVAQCRPPFGELPGGVITMHVVVQPSSAKAKTEKKVLRKDDTAPVGCAFDVVSESLSMYLQLRGKLDAEAEREKLTKMKKKMQKRQADLARTMNATGYKERAPQHVQDNNMKKLNELMKELKIVEEEEIKFEQILKEQQN